MELLLDRKYKKDTYTIGNLYINGVWFCNVLEDTDRGLDQHQTLEEIQARKIKGRTAIPKGRYRITLAVQSPKFAGRAQYAFCNGYLPRLENVKGFEGILIHIGNSNADTDGCLLVGTNDVKGRVCNSTDTFKKLYKRLLSDKNNLHITIK